MPMTPCVRPSQTPGTGSPPTRITTGRSRPAPASRYVCVESAQRHQVSFCGSHTMQAAELRASGIGTASETELVVARSKVVLRAWPPRVESKTVPSARMPM